MKDNWDMACKTRIATSSHPCVTYAELAHDVLQPVLILGGDSVLASEFAIFLEKKNVTYFRTSRKFAKHKRTFYLDASNIKSIEEFLAAISDEGIQFGSVVNFIAQVDRESSSSIAEKSHNFSQIVAANLVFPYVFFESLVPLMKNGSKIVQISGGGASSAMPGLPAYSATKAGLIRLIETLAIAYSSRNIDINALGPGPFLSPIFNRANQLLEGSLANQLHNSEKRKQVPFIDLQNTCMVIARMISEEFNGVSGNFFSAQWDDWSKSILNIAHHASCNNNLKLRRVICD